MKSEKKKRQGYGKLLEAWEPPDTAGDAIGCLATSFTFSPVFFEEECLSRFLGLESDPNEDGPLYLIEREEKLSGVVCAAALVDQHHCRGSRSLRWDLIPARPKRGILHAKLSLLCWNQHVRVIITSANITEHGYRRNQEVFAVLDFADNGDLPVVLLNSAIDFLRDTIEAVGSGAGREDPAAARCRNLLEKVMGMATKWNLPEKIKPARGPTINFIFAGPGRSSVFESLREAWQDWSPPTEAVITSPFYDEDNMNKPAGEIWNILNRKGRAEVCYQVKIEEVPDKAKILVHAPETIKTTRPINRRMTAVSFRQIKENSGIGEGKEAIRSIHLKSIWLENERYALYMIGSSNFTSAGMGLGSSPNFEANVAFSVNYARNKSLYRMLEAGHLWGDALDERERWQWLGSQVSNEDSEGDEVVLPAAFGPAIYNRDHELKGFIVLHFSGNPPAGWAVREEAKTDIVYDELGWQDSGRLDSVRIPWPQDRPPSGFDVVWKGASKAAWWPVNISDMTVLPPPEDLKDLPLEILIDILTSARPLHQVMRNWLNRRAKRGDEEQRPLINPHDRVDTSSFLLQRTRRISYALSALRSRLERPALTEESLAWRLHGPVGVSALAKAVAKEAKSDQERAFILTELALELSRVRPIEIPGSLRKSLVKKRIAEAIKELRENILNSSLENNQKLKRYIQSVLDEISP